MSVKPRLDDVLQLYMAADVLIDKTSMAEAAAELAAVLHTLTCRSDKRAALAQVTASLPEPLLLASLRHIPLPHCLAHLPPTIHARALRAHHPSIDASHSLSLHHLPLAATRPALAATATLTSLCSVSFAGVTLVSEPPASVRPLSSLLALTNLDLSNTAPSAPAVATLAAKLPRLPRLAALDLSDNALTAPAMRALLPACAGCTSLVCLSLLATMQYSRAGADSIHVLAAGASSLSRLTCLSVGGRGHEYDVPECAAAPNHLLRSIGTLQQLRRLALEFNCLVQPTDVPAAAAALEALSRLQHLRLTVPRAGGSLGLGAHGEAAEASSLSAMPRALCTLAALTSLELHFVDRDYYVALRPRQAWAAAIRKLPGLRCLTLRELGEEGDAECLAVALVHLRHLTNLHLIYGRFWHDKLDAVTIAACSLPCLRVLRVPVSTAHSGDACRAALLGATQLERLMSEIHVDDRTSGVCDARPWVPLIPTAVELHFTVSSCDEWLRPLIPAVAALGTLDVFEVQAGGIWSRSTVLRALLEAAAGVKCRKVDMFLNCVGGPTQAEIVQQYAGPSVTSLALPSLNYVDDGEVTLAGEIALPSLTTLRCRRVVDAHSLCMRWLPGSQLHTLEIINLDCQDLELLRELLGHLRHLRTVKIMYTSGWDRESISNALRKAVLGCHACKDAVCDGLDIRQRALHRR